ncbi:MAG TPA: ATP-binding protein [Candidatus Limnocylindrales bacterium]|nr:ATP-binding protein [Candidatus Limnocylindrales bacterium]
MDIRAIKAALSDKSENLGDGLILVDENNRVRVFNSNVEQLFSIRGKEARNRKIDEIIPQANLLALFSKALKERVVLSNVEVILTEPQERILNINIIPIFSEEDRHYRGALLLITDVTQKIMLIEKIVHQSRLFTVSSLANWVAHEIRNPLTSMNVHFELLKSEIEEIKNRSPEVDHLIATLQEEILRLDRNLSSFLNSGRLPPPEKVSLQINQVIKSVVDFQYPVARLSKVIIQTELEEGLPLIELDEDQFRLVLLNLIRNAIQAMPEGGNLKILTRRVEKYIEVEVSDTGCGIPKEDLEKIFDFLYTTKEQGSGLGLPIAQKIVRSHNGKIEVVSEKGKGTTFIIKLPISSEK